VHLAVPSDVRWWLRPTVTVSEEFGLRPCFEGVAPKDWACYGRSKTFLTSAGIARISFTSQTFAGTQPR
jgi:hypothetical protein